MYSVDDSCEIRFGQPEHVGNSAESMRMREASPGWSEARGGAGSSEGEGCGGEEREGCGGEERSPEVCRLILGRWLLIIFTVVHLPLDEVARV